MPPFPKGNPGGPGRPRGSRNKLNLMLDQLAEADAEKMVRRMIENANEGDRVAARLVLSRIWAAPKGRAVAVELPDIKTPADLLKAHAAVASAITSGTLTPQDGAALSSMLETHRRAFELVSQEMRVAHLEGEVRDFKEKIGFGVNFEKIP
jgi:hypothetical protein